ncbi:MAG: hypothetical protein PVG14_19760 [Anaerolineales bacterium]
MVTAERTAQAVRYLVEYTSRTGVDYLTHTIYKLAAGSLAPDDALGQIREWVQNDCIIEFFGAETASRSWSLNTLPGPGRIF